MWLIRTVSFSKMESLFTEWRKPNMAVCGIKVSKTNNLKKRWKRGSGTLQTLDQDFP